jgi:hypothetical protein
MLGQSTPGQLTSSRSSTSLDVIAVDGHTTTLTATQLGSLPHVTVDVDDRGTAAEFQGVPLSNVLSAAGVELGDSLRGSRLTEVVLVEAADHYRVTFALAEADPAFATRQIIVADKRDGKPLDANEGPFRVVAPGDKRSARWVRRVISLKIVAAR